MATYTELNANLVEAFGNLERLCNQIYHTQHGVTNYINDMEQNSFKGGRSIFQWDHDLKRLKDIRHKRNQLSHGEVPFGCSWATEADIAYALEFRQRILNGSDPLTLFRRSKMEGPVAQTQVVHDIPQTSSPPLRPTRPSGRSVGCVSCLALIIMVIAIVCGWCFLFN